jgi:hypothetical protein
MVPTKFSVSDFWQGYELVVRNYDELHDSIAALSSFAQTAKRNIAWRGQSNADWALTSKLYRELAVKALRYKTESELAKIEKSILIKLREWGLHSQKNTGRLSVLSQLAMLQHYGAPTRLIDISFNAMVAAFFATEQSGSDDDVDARLFAIDITDRIINESKYLREWEDTLDTPWSDSFRREKFRSLPENSWLDSKDAPKDEETYRLWCNYEWTTRYYAWKPPSLDPRISAQNGGFLLGGVVGTSAMEGVLSRDATVSRGAFQVIRPGVSDQGASSHLFIEELRSLTSIAVKPQKFPRGSIRSNTRNAIYSIRITGDAKSQIQRSLKTIYGYSHSTIYELLPENRTVTEATI